MKMEKLAKNGQMVQNCYPLSPDMDELEVTLNTKANRSDLDIALSLTGEQADALNVLLGTKANQSDVVAELALKANQTDVALTTEVPSTTDILNNSNVGATAVGGANAYP